MLNKKFITTNITIFISCICLTCVSCAYAAIPHTISYQGKAQDKYKRPLEGAHLVVFRLYDSQTGGNKLWEEAYPDVRIKKGIFSVLLGSVKNLGLAFDKPYWLQVEIDNEAMAERERLTSVGYVVRAETAENSAFKGAIVIWSGSVSSIPAGWALCNGSNGTPDLRDRFIAGAGGSLAQTGGAAEVTFGANNLPRHNHFNPSHTHPCPAHTHKGPSHQHYQSDHTHAVGIIFGTGTSGYYSIWDVNKPDHFTTEGGGGLLMGSAGSGTTTSLGAGETSGTGIYASYEGSGKPQSNLPPYYALAYIMKL